MDVSAIVTGHAEGRLSVATLRSMSIAIEAARADGLKVQPIFVLDRADELTTNLFRNACDKSGLVIETDFGDQGAARNEAVKNSKGKKIAFLDGDDLWCRTWLRDAYRFIREQGDDVIAHPEFNYFFEDQATIFQHIDQDDNEFRLDILRLHNYWDALGMCDAKIHEKFPYTERDIANGWAYEDWQWNCETYAAGFRHKVVHDSVLFKRRQKQSQNIRAGANKSRIRRNTLSHYGHKAFTAEV